MHEGNKQFSCIAPPDGGETRPQKAARSPGEPLWGDGAAGAGNRPRRAGRPREPLRGGRPARTACAQGGALGFGRKTGAERYRAGGTLARAALRDCQRIADRFPRGNAWGSGRTHLELRSEVLPDPARAYRPGGKEQSNSRRAGRKEAGSTAGRAGGRRTA